jgi:hypothetical protein
LAAQDAEGRCRYRGLIKATIGLEETAARRSFFSAQVNSRMSAIDTVDGSSTGTEVPCMWVLLTSEDVRLEDLSPKSDPKRTLLDAVMGPAPSER